MAYVIRRYRDGDAPALALLTKAAIRTVGTRAYSPEQVEAWAARHPQPERFAERAAAGQVILVAADGEDAPVAYAVLEQDGHLDMLYCHPDHSRRGLADALLAEAQAHALATGVPMLFTEASEIARPVFERAGYCVSHRRDFSIEGANGTVAIHNYAMEKRLVVDTPSRKDGDQDLKLR